MLAILLLALFGAALGQFQFQVCDPLQLQTCQATFNDELGINPGLGVLTYQDLRVAVQNTYASQGAYGLAQTCLAFNSYKTCFSNAQQYESCAAFPLGLLINSNGTSTGITQDQAFGYTKIFNQFNFACGSGYSLFLNNDACASTVFLNRTSDLNDCDYSFTQSIQQDPKLVCSYVERAANCYQTVFGRNCGGTPEVVWWGCEYERTGSQNLYPQCSQIFCKYNEGRPRP